MAAMDTTADSATATLEDAELQAADAGEPVAREPRAQSALRWLL